MKAEMSCDGLVVTLFGYASCPNETTHAVATPTDYNGRPLRPPHDHQYLCDPCFAALTPPAYPGASPRRPATDEERHGEARRARREFRERPSPYTEQFVKNLGELGLTEGPEWP
jgi:hypothetical protein